MRYILIRGPPVSKNEDFETRRRMFSFIHPLSTLLMKRFLSTVCQDNDRVCVAFYVTQSMTYFFRKKKKNWWKKIRISLFSFMTLLHLFRNPSLRKFNCHLKEHFCTLTKFGVSFLPCACVL